LGFALSLSPNLFRWTTRSGRGGQKWGLSAPGKYVFFGLAVAVLSIFAYLSAAVDIYLREHSFVNFSHVMIILGLIALLLVIVWTTWPGKFRVKPTLQDGREEVMFASVLISGGLVLDLTGPLWEASFSQILFLNAVFISLIIYLGYRRRR